MIWSPCWNAYEDNFFYFVWFPGEKKFWRMITDVQLAICANLLGAGLFLLIVLYHYIAANHSKSSWVKLTSYLWGVSVHHESSIPFNLSYTSKYEPRRRGRVFVIRDKTLGFWSHQSCQEIKLFNIKLTQSFVLLKKIMSCLMSRLDLRLATFRSCKHFTTYFCGIS